MQENEVDFGDCENDGDNLPSYAPVEEIDFRALDQSICRLKFFGDDPFLRSQMFSFGYVDQFITMLEYDLLRKQFREERIPIDDSVLLSAQSQMWIYAIYEILRTWRQRVDSIKKLAKDNKLESALKKLEDPLEFSHHGRNIRALQYRAAVEDKNLIENIESDVRRISIPFLNLEFIRMSLAKHEVAKRKGSIAHAPGFGMRNKWCGSLDYDMETGRGSLGYISRRDIADMFRSIWENQEPPSDDEIKKVEDVLLCKDIWDEP